MYLRPAFTETDLDRIAATIAENSFGVLVTRTETGMDASHIPFLVARAGDGLVLSAHLGRPNAQCATFDGGAAVAIFGGPHAYIAPGWYAAQPAVPTWDYIAVHVHGVLEPVDDAAGTLDILRGLSVHDPLGFTPDSPPAAYMDGMLRGIRAFRLRSTKIEGQWKMSQNRSVADRQGVVAGLRDQGHSAVAHMIAADLPI
ncbi:MAG: FMN-binding negative transcriptional regulator [Acetobacteraceae bacterium]|nr:FMN-binding negative transcriptional regulator [Acetobacteraceae bacterium]